MIDEKNLTNLPFEEEGGAGLYGHKPHVMHVRPPRYMSTRSSVFLAFAVSGLNMALMSNVPLYLPFAITLAMILIWSVTLRFFRTTWASPVVLLIMMIPSVAFAHLFKSYVLAGSLGIFCLGFAALAHLNLDDAEEDVRPAVWKEVIVPFLFACAASVTGYYASFMFDKRFLFVENIISVTFLILTSILISKTSGSRYFFTSKRLTEFWDIPVAEFSQTRIFLFAKAKFIITVLSCYCAIFAVYFFVPFEWKMHLFIPVSVLAAFPFMYIVRNVGKDSESIFGTKYFIYESFIAAILSGVFFSYSISEVSVTTVIYSFLLIIGTDIIGSALLAVIRRRQIFVSRSKYIDGTPFMLTMFSLLIMLVECCLYNMF